MRDVAGLTMLAMTAVIPVGVARAILGMFVGHLMRMKTRRAEAADAQRV